MTVCVAVKVQDCIVFAADSASTLANGPDVLNVFNNADKVFNLHRDLPLVAMTCGMGAICGVSIANLAKELRVELTSGEDKIGSVYTVSEIASFTERFFRNKYSEHCGDAGPRSDDFF